MLNPTRRAFLASGAVAAAAAVGVSAGFTRHVHHRIATPPSAPPAELTAALAAHRMLIAGCDASAAGGADLGTLATELAAHREAMLAVLQNYPGWRLSQAAGPSAPPASVSPPAEPVPVTLPELRTALQSQAARLANSCRDWPLGEPEAVLVVPLFGSISACLTGHVGLLS